MAKHYTVDGEVREVAPANGKYFTYAELQGFVKDGDNAMIEIVPFAIRQRASGKRGGQIDRLANQPKSYRAMEARISNCRLSRQQ